MKDRRLVNWDCTFKGQLYLIPKGDLGEIVYCHNSSGNHAWLILLFPKFPDDP
ncbi:hypothetical protein NC652_018255 [Populus alba x Populus x berolinensis]|nr:hypothetical protein NC652_018255 [Populus alba x Populus x berolinensis]